MTNPVNIYVEISEKFNETAQRAMMPNENNNPLIDAYNKGVNMVYGMFSQILNISALESAFNGETAINDKKGE